MLFILFILSEILRACLKITWSPAARDFGCGQGGEVRAGLANGASPQRVVTAEPTQATDKRPAARRVFAEKAAWLRYSMWVNTTELSRTTITSIILGLTTGTRPVFTGRRAIRLTFGSSGFPGRGDRRFDCTEHL